MRLYLLALAALFAGSASSQAVAQTSFRSDVAPILVRRCLTCHGEQKFKGDYQLHNFESLVKAGASGVKAVEPGKPNDSHLLSLVTSDDADERMPKGADRMPDAEIDVLRRWISEGAKLDGGERTTPLVNIAVWKHPDAPERYPRPFPVTALAFSPDGHELAAGGLHEITIWNPEDGALKRRINDVAERTYSLVYSQDGSKLFAGCGTPAQVGEVKLFNATDGSLIRHFGSAADCVFSIALSADEKRLAACGADRQVQVFDVASGKLELTLKDHGDWVMGVAFSPDGKRIATASRDRTCKVFDSSTGELVTTFTDHNEAVYGIAYHTDGKNAITCGADKKLRYWLADDPGWENDKMVKKKKHQIGESSGFSSEVYHLVVRGDFVFACSADQTTRQYDIKSRNQIKSFPGAEGWLFALDYFDGGKMLATGGLNGQIRLWKTDAKDEKELTLRTFYAAPGYEPPAAPASTGE